MAEIVLTQAEADALIATSPAPPHLWQPGADVYATCIAFMTHCNIVDRPAFVLGLF